MPPWSTSTRAKAIKRLCPMDNNGCGLSSSSNKAVSAYLIPMFFELAPGTNKEAVQRVLSAIVERHSILRTVIEQDEQGAAVQRVLPHGPQMHTVRVPEQEDVQSQMTREAQRPFELTEEPPIRIRFYEQGKRCWLLVVFHHIGFDGWSHPIWQREF